MILSIIHPARPTFHIFCSVFIGPVYVFSGVEELPT